MLSSLNIEQFLIAKKAYYKSLFFLIVNNLNDIFLNINLYNIFLKYLDKIDLTMFLMKSAPAL